MVSRLKKYGYQLDERAERKVRLAINYASDLGRVEKERVELSEAERKAISQLIERIKAAASSDEIQGAIFEAARSNGLSPREFFKKLYMVFLGRDRGPRLGPYLWDLGKDRAITVLEECIGRR